MPIGNPVTLTSNVASKTISDTATASQTLFNVTGGYRINSLGVFKNGSRLQDGVDYIARDGLTVTLLSAASGGDKLQFVVFDTFRVAEAIRPAVDEQTIRGNLNVVGILSTTNLEGPISINITSGIQTFHDVRVGGALTVAGTLTYEDVGNTNTTGIATFSGGLIASGVGATVTTLNVTGVSTFAGAINGNLTGNATGLSGTPNIDCGTGSFTGDVDIADKIVHTGDTDTAIRFPAADTITAETGGTERLRIDSAGRMGLGVTPPTGYGSGRTSLDIHSSGATVSHLALTNSTTGSNGSSNGFNIIQSGLNTLLYLRESGFMSFSTAGSEALRITSAGLVGINCTPLAALQVKAGTDANILFSTMSSEASIEAFNDAGNANVPLRYRATEHKFHISGTEKLRIDSNGKVGININNPGSYNSAGNELVLGNTGNNGGMTIVSGTGNNGHIFFADGTGAPNQGIIKYEHATDQMAFNIATTEKLRITSDGVTVTGSVSDSKGNVRSIPQNSQASTYTLVAADAGKHILAQNTITIPNSVLSGGDAITIINHTAGNITLSSSLTTLYMSSDGTTTSTRTLATRGMATLLFVSGTSAYISGVGLS